MVSINPSGEFDHLIEHGWQVVENVLPHDVCDRVIDEEKKWFRAFNPAIDFDDIKGTWTSKNRPFQVRSVMMQQYGVGQLQTQWDIRQHPSVYGLFARLWNTEELLVSFDGFSFGPPPEKTARPQFSNPNKPWLHLDQGPKKQGLHCVQGFVVLDDLEEDDAPLQLLSGSHKHHTAFFEKFAGKFGDWVLFDDEQREWLLSQPGVSHMRVPAKKGSLVLWDSRTAHSGSKPKKGRANPDHWVFKNYVCYLPASLATEKDLAKKRAQFAARKTCSHWPIRSKAFGDNPRFGRKFPEHMKRPEPQLNDLGKKLAGLEYWPKHKRLLATITKKKAKVTRKTKAARK